MCMSNSSAGGENCAVSVNRCPPAGIPAPFNNTSKRAAAIPNVSHVLLCGGPAHNSATVIPASSGDEAGSMGGVVSGTVCSQSRNIRGAETCLLQGMPTTRMTDCTQQNMCNAVGSGTSPSQTRVLNMAA